MALSQSLTNTSPSDSFSPRGTCDLQARVWVEEVVAQDNPVYSGSPLLSNLVGSDLNPSIKSHPRKVSRVLSHYQWTIPISYQ